MAVITLNGQLGSNARAIGERVALQTGMDFVDRLIMAEAGKRVGATVEALEEREHHPWTMRDRLARLFQGVLGRSAYAGAGADPFEMEIGALLQHPYPVGEPDTATRGQGIDDHRFFQVVGDVIRDLARDGNVVIVGRGSNIILQDVPQALHVGAVAPLSVRIGVIMEREGLDQQEAERFITEGERARVGYFRRHFQAHPDDPLLYHLVVNTGLLGEDRAVEAVVREASGLR